MANVNEALLDEYTAAKKKAKQWKKTAEELKPEVEEEMAKHGNAPIKTTEGKFSITTRTSFSYSNDVKELQEELDDLKAREEADGTAEMSENSYVSFYANE